MLGGVHLTQSYDYIIHEAPSTFCAYLSCVMLHLHAQLVVQGGGFDLPTLCGFWGLWKMKGGNCRSLLLCFVFYEKEEEEEEEGGLCVVLW